MLSCCRLNAEIPEGVTEIHPGAYSFCDWQQVSVGGCDEDDIACSVATRIVGDYPFKQQILVDAGFTAMSHDLGRNETTGYFNVSIVGHPELALVRVTQELGIIKAKNGAKIDFEKFKAGQMLFIQPYHCCATADKFYEYLVTDGGEEYFEKWQPVKGW